MNNFKQEQEKMLRDEVEQKETDLENQSERKSSREDTERIENDIGSLFNNI